MKDMLHIPLKGEVGPSPGKAMNSPLCLFWISILSFNDERKLDILPNFISNSDFISILEHVHPAGPDQMSRNNKTVSQITQAMKGFQGQKHIDNRCS